MKWPKLPDDTKELKIRILGGEPLKYQPHFVVKQRKAIMVARTTEELKALIVDFYLRHPRTEAQDLYLRLQAHRPAAMGETRADSGPGLVRWKALVNEARKELVRDKVLLIEERGIMGAGKVYVVNTRTPFLDALDGLK